MKSLMRILLHLRIVIVTFSIISALAVTAAYSTGKLKFSRPGTKMKMDFVPNEVLVKYKNSVSYSSRNASVLSMGAQKLKEFGKSHVVHMRLPQGKSVKDTVSKLKASPDVEFAQPNYIYHATVVPNDTDYGQLWGLRNSGQTISAPSYTTNNPGTPHMDMNLEKSWNEKTNCSAVTVAVIDSGVNYNHEDLAANMWDGSSEGYPNHGYDFIDNDNDPMDLNGHGTHVAGILGAVGNNNKGTTGVCWNASIMAVRALDSAGTGTSASIASGIDFAVTNHAKVINMSLSSTAQDSTILTALQNAQTAEVVVVVAAGNDGVDLDGSGNNAYPCEYDLDNIVCVAALDQSYDMASFSNYSDTSVDVGAPGTNIRSTWNGSTTETPDYFNNSDTLDWTRTGSSDIDEVWDYFNGGPNPDDKYLVNPYNIDFSTHYYDWDINARVYKDFGSLTQSSDAVTVSMFFQINVDSSDHFCMNYDTVSSDPFTSGTNLLDISGNGYAYITLDMSRCIQSTACTVGYQLETNFSDEGYGVAINHFSIKTTVLNNTTYNTIDGTSMASPHVAGLAAMLVAYNGNNAYYTTADVIASIKTGGDTVSALDGKSTTGKAADSWGSLCYINAPTCVSTDAGQ